MHSRIDIIAEYRSAPGAGSGRGRTVIRSIRGGLHFAGRETGPTLGRSNGTGMDGDTGDGPGCANGLTGSTVHLVGTAAGPLGGDDVVIAITVGPGARLAVRSAGATIIQPGLHRPDSRLQLQLNVGDEAELDVAMQPTVVCHGAAHEALATLELTGSAQVSLLEQVLLGRSNEPGGSWTGRTRLTRDAAPELRHTLRSALLRGDGVRVISTLLRSGVAAVPAVAGHAVAMPLAAGGLLVTATGTALLPTQLDLRAATAQALAPVLASSAEIHT